MTTENPTPPSIAPWLREHAQYVLNHWDANQCNRAADELDRSAATIRELAEALRTARLLVDEKLVLASHIDALLSHLNLEG